MKRVLLYTALVITPVACTSEDSLTQPAAPEHPSALTTATAVNSWSSKAAYPGLVTVEGFLAMAPNAAGQSIVYYLAGHPESEAEAVDGKPVKAYNVATDTWTTKAAGVEVWQTNGGGRIGSRIYFSGGFAMDDDFRHEIFMTGEVWAYDYVGDRMIRKTGMPIIAANGVSGVIGGKLYVLPGRCSGLFFPDPGYCSSSDTRRFFRYDPAVDRWVSRPWAPHNDAAGAAGVLQGRLYIVGGVNPRTGTATADLDMYDPATNEWRTLAPIPSAGRAIGAVIGNRFFVIVQPSTGAARSYDYTPGTNLWRIRPAPSWENDGVVQVMLGGTAHLFAAGDADRFEDNTPNASELYTR
ncbi:MAG: Kelch repeat-containing protein [Gemmatimonadales bacterium]